MKTGYLAIGTYPSGANVYIDNVQILDDKKESVLTPVILSMEEGFCTIKLALTGYCDEYDYQQIIRNENVSIFHYFNIC